MNYNEGIKKMTIVYHENWPIKKGEHDAKRHQKKIDDAIRKGAKDVIGNETIITGEGKKKVRVPVKGLKDYRFVHGNTSGVSGGMGQGEGQPGDVIGRKPGKGMPGNGAGQGEGGGDMEAEVDIDYLLDIMFEDLGLPYLDPKKKNSIEIPKGWKYTGISKHGADARIHQKRTMKEALQRHFLYIMEVINDSKLLKIYKRDDDGIDEAQEKAEKALQQSKGDIEEAITIINEDRLDENQPTGAMIEDEDLRFKQIEEDVEICSKAVIFALMDVSGSMTPDKKYLMRSLLFWIVSWLKKQYEFVDIRFIQHTTEAKEVDENTFFNKAESGGTQSSSAFQKMNYIIDTEYPLDEWNIYGIYCSDGEDWNPKESLDEIEVILSKHINMLSYVEVKPDSYDYGYSTLLPEIQKKWSFQESSLSKNGKYWINNDLRFLLSVIKDKSHIWPCIQHILGINHPERTE